MYAGIEAGTAIPSIAALASWGLSFFGINRYLQEHEAEHCARPDNGFYMLLSIFVSIAVAIAVAGASKLLLVQTASSEIGQLTAAKAAIAIAVVIIWGISFLGIARYMKSHSNREDNGFLILLSGA